jgi:cobalamin biosynthesis protein CobD/CbiB
MFGKTVWFKEKKIGWGLRPVTWQGWVYSLVWLLVVAIPFLLLLLAMHRAPEAAIWMGVSLLAMLLDVRSIVRQIRAAVRRKEDENILYIGDDEAGEVQTRNYNLQLRN